MKARAGCFPVIAMAGLCVLAGAHAQDFPTKPVRILATEAGGGGDIVSRLIAPELTAVWGKQVIVDNRTSVVANEMTAKSPPDGHTLLINSSSLWLWQYLRSDARWDAVKDFAPVTWAIRQPNILVVHPSLPVTTLRGLISLAKSRPGDLNYATGVIGATTHLAAELFCTMAGINVVRIYYKGTAPAMNGLIAGQVHMMFPNAASATPLVKTGRLKALAVTTAQPTALAPGLPTMTSAGYEAETVLGIFAPGGTPPALVNAIHQEIARALNKQEVKDRLFNIGIEVMAGTPEQMSGVMKMEMSKWGKVIKDAGIRLD